MLTRSTTRIFLWALPLLFAIFACQTATNLIHTDSPAPVQSPTLTAMPMIPETGSISAQVALEASCPSTLATIMVAGTTTQGANEPDPEHYLVTYKVMGDQITDPIFETIPMGLKNEQSDLATQQQIWRYFAALIPEQNRQMVSRYSVLTDGEANLLAAVSQTNGDPFHWVLEVDLADSDDTANLTFTMIHEFGHLLTLNADQVPPSLTVSNNPSTKNIYNQEVAMCSSYFPGEGCSQPNSYINQFYQRYWSDIYVEWSQIDQIEDERDYYEKMIQFYTHYEDRFVTEYATTNPEEDIAETWAYFVLSPKPTGPTIADQKVLFFYEHPELVELRAQILSNLCTIFPE